MTWVICHVYCKHLFLHYFINLLILYMTLRGYTGFCFVLFLINLTFPLFLENLTLPFSVWQDCGPSLGLAAGIPSLVAAALLVSLLFMLIHRRRSSNDSSEVISKLLWVWLCWQESVFQWTCFGLRVSGSTSVSWGTWWWIFLPLNFYLRLMILYSGQSWSVTHLHFRKSVAIRMVFGVAESNCGEGQVLPWQMHTCTVGMFSEVKDRRA